jgi:hypothetical protein
MISGYDEKQVSPSLCPFICLIVFMIGCQKEDPPGSDVTADETGERGGGEICFLTRKDLWTDIPMPLIVMCFDPSAFYPFWFTRVLF